MAARVMVQGWDFLDAKTLWWATDDFLDTPLKDLELSVRSMNALQDGRLMIGYTGRRDPVLTVRDLIQYSEVELMCLSNFGRKSLREIKEMLARHRLTLRNHSLPRRGLDVT